MIGTALSIDIWKSIKDLFKLDQLKEKLNDGKITIQEFWDSLNGLGGLGQSQGSAMLLDAYLDELLLVFRLFS
jgi:hypothetical protein